MSDRPIGILCDLHVIPLLLYLRGKGSCRKLDIYKEVNRSAGITRKLQRMADAGLVSLDLGDNTTVVEITDLGRHVADRPSRSRG